MREHARRAHTAKLRNMLLQNATLYNRMAEWAERQKRSQGDGADA